MRSSTRRGGLPPNHCLSWCSSPLQYHPSVGSRDKYFPMHLHSWAMAVPRLYIHIEKIIIYNYRYLIISVVYFVINVSTEVKNEKIRDYKDGIVKYGHSTNRVTICNQRLIIVLLLDTSTYFHYVHSCHLWGVRVGGWRAGKLIFIYRMWCSYSFIYGFM